MSKLKKALRFSAWTMILLAVVSAVLPRHTIAGIIQAIIPAAAPTANKQGNSSKFQLGAGSPISGDCASFDANLNVTGPGTGAGCGGASSSGGGIVVYSGTAGISLAGTLFFPVGGGSQASATETSVDADVQATTTISRFGANLSVALGTTIGVNNSVAFTWRKNGSSQVLTCTITNPATSCGDSVNSFAIVPGDLIAIQAVFTGTISAAPNFVLAAQTGTLLSGSVGNGTQFQIGQYTGAGTTTALNGVSIPNCPDSGGNHVNFANGTGVFTCGTSGTGGAPGGSTGQTQYNNASAFGGVDGFILPNRTTSPGPVASLPQTGWTIVNGAILGDFASGQTTVQCVDSSSQNWRFVTRTITVPYTLIAMISGYIGAPNGAAESTGVFITDGTKMEDIELIYVTGSNPRIRVEAMNSPTSDNSTLAGPTASVVSAPVMAVKIVNNSTNRIWSYWTNGAWVQFLSEGTTAFLTENRAGFGCFSQTSAPANFVASTLLYWSVQ